MPLAKGTIASEIPTFKGDIKKSLAVFRDVCNGVHALHVGGIFHRDLKPSNCLRMPDGTLVMADLGIARFDERDTETITKTNASLGTAAYFAPEQCSPGGARTADARADVFQLGKTLYQLYVDELPMYMNLDKVPVGLRHIITRATKHEKEDRYQTVAELMDAVQMFLQSLDPNVNVKAAFENVLSATTQEAAQGRYDGEQISKLLGYLTTLIETNASVGLTLFDNIHSNILKIAAQYLSEESVRFLKVYVKAIEERIGGYGFAYAEVVASAMRVMLKATDNTEVKSLALEAALIAAVSLNRFAAMDAFASMLKSINEDEALPIAEMLKRQMEWYRTIASQIGDGELPLILDAVRNEAIDLNEKDRKKSPAF
jgi:eukaryotic-like serine/threonine-protein kinase